MSEACKVAAAAVLASLLAVVLRRHVPELALLLGLTAAAGVLLYCAGTLEQVLSFLAELTAVAGVSDAILQPVVKTCGIGLVTRLASDFCKDAQEGMLASAVELAGTALALAAVLPLFTAVLELLTGLL